MRVLLVGGGAREHALAWKLRQSPRLTDLFVAPGNAGTAAIAENLPLPANDIEGLAHRARELHADLVVVGPEEPLARGLIDRLAAMGIASFGPSRAAAEIEWSKSFAAGLMERAGIPTARSTRFDEFEPARDYVLALPEPPVIKADGLAAGKGVTVAETIDEAVEALRALMVDNAAGQAGASVLVTERLRGREVSAMAFTDGRAVAHMPFSCDHKAANDGDHGPNTGGMGAYSPALWLSDEVAATIRQDVTARTVAAMAEEGHPYRGVLYPGMMVTARGPQVLEYNCRFGDPETQVLLPRLRTDLLEVLWAVANNRLDRVDLEWSDDACVGVVMASGGYPGRYATGFPIEGLDELEPEVIVFHAGTRLGEHGVETAGGRVLTVSATAPTMEEARDRAYRNVARIHFQGMHYRRDIGATAGVTA